MDRWSRCPGSVRLSKDLPSTTSSYAEEGTLAHDLAADWLTNGVKPVFPDNEMHDAVQIYRNYVDATKEFGCRVYVEHKFDLSRVHPGCFGTADAVIWNAETRHLEVVDFKYGAGTFVSANNNPQLRYYGLGALLDLKLPAHTIKLTIVQPRYEAQDGPVRSEELDVIDFLDFRADLITYAQATEAPDAPLHPGDHCKWCPAKPFCPELKKQAIEVAKKEFSASVAYDAQELKEALDKRDILKTWLKTIDEFAYAVLEKGGTIPGYKLVAKRPTRKWKDDGQVVSMLKAAGYSDKQVYGEQKPQSPAQIEKVLGKHKGLVADLIVAESSGNVVVEVSDPRPPVQVLTAAEEFTAIPAAD